ncbi:MAG: glycosyltransferase [Actinomycetota bacterium]
MARVAFIIPSLGAGGAERSLELSLPGLIERGIEPRIICFDRRPHGSHDIVERSSVPVEVIGGDRVRRIGAIRRSLRADPVDLAHTSVQSADLVGRVGARLAGTRSVGTLVNTTYDPVRLDDPHVRRVPFEANRLADGATARLSHGFRAITQAVKDSAVAHMRIDPDRIEVIPRGRQLDRYDARPDDRRRLRKEWGAGDDTLVVGNVARHERQKGLDALIGAVDAIARRGTEVLLVQAGRDGGTSALLRSEIGRLGLDERVRLLGHQDDVAADVLPGLDVFAFPSRYEGLGGALIEAMATGLPIVTTDLPVTREVTAEQALFVPTGDVAALADAILAAPTSIDRAAVRAAAARFDLEHVLDLEAAWLRRSAP